jgi:hypothetical protein
MFSFGTKASAFQPGLAKYNYIINMKKKLIC